MKFDDLIETIDMLTATEADTVIDWQMTDSPAAKVQRQGDAPQPTAQAWATQRAVSGRSGPASRSICAVGSA